MRRKLDAVSTTSRYVLQTNVFFTEVIVYALLFENIVFALCRTEKVNQSSPYVFLVPSLDLGLSVTLYRYV